MLPPALRRVDGDFLNAIVESPVLLAMSDYALGMVRMAVHEAFAAGLTGAERPPEAPYVPWRRLRAYRRNVARAWVRRGFRAGADARALLGPA